MVELTADGDGDDDDVLEASLLALTTSLSTRAALTCAPRSPRSSLITRRMGILERGGGDEGDGKDTEVV